MDRVANKTGCDITLEFVQMVSQKGIKCIKCNAIDLPFENDSFDYVLSVAVIHHLSSDARRQVAVEEMIRTTKVGGFIFIEVWALEQKNVDKPRKAVFLNDQDTFVPYKIGEDVYERYYHLFKDGELTTLVDNAAKNTNCLIKIVETKYDSGNWVIVLQKTGINDIYSAAADTQWCSQIKENMNDFLTTEKVVEQLQTFCHGFDVMRCDRPTCGDEGIGNRDELRVPFCSKEELQYFMQVQDNRGGEEEDENYVNDLIRGKSPSKKIKF